MSLASKQARAEQLRGELTSLRVEKEAALQTGHNDVAEAQLDAELVRLEREVELAKAETAAVKSGGSVEDALAAMREAAANEQPDGMVNLAVPLETETNGPVVDQVAVAEEVVVPEEGIVFMPGLEVETTDANAPKADGE